MENTGNPGSPFFFKKNRHRIHLPSEFEKLVPGIKAAEKKIFMEKRAVAGEYF